MHRLQNMTQSTIGGSLPGCNTREIILFGKARDMARIQCVTWRTRTSVGIRITREKWLLLWHKVCEFSRPTKAFVRPPLLVYDSYAV